MTVSAQRARECNAAAQQGPATTISDPIPARFRRAVFRTLVRTMLALHYGLLTIAKRLGPGKRDLKQGECHVLLTATFYSDSWLLAHIGPLGASRYTKKITVVATRKVPQCDKVEAVYPPAWLQKMVGGVPSRLAMFAWTALRTRPDVIGGFHLLLNGVLAELLAAFTGARSLYICGGGPREVVDGGVHCDNRLFRRLEVPDAVVERQLLRAVGGFDFVVTMGKSGAAYFRKFAGLDHVEVLPGGIRPVPPRPNNVVPEFDLILVGRLSQVKRVDLFLESLATLRRSLPQVRAVIVGGGPDYDLMVRKSGELNLSDCVTFAGFQSDVVSWLHRSRVFVLTSDSEGLSLALMEAFMCGLPAVVSNVGDLADLVVNGESGYLVSERTPNAFASAFQRLLTNPEHLHSCGRNAAAAAAKLTTSESALRWDRVFEKHQNI